jgi:hypothetical protein
MTMEKFPVNADDITHLQTLFKGYVLSLQRNASMYIYIVNFINRVKGTYASLRICANIFLERWCKISSPGTLPWLRAKC